MLMDFCDKCLNYHEAGNCPADAATEVNTEKEPSQSVKEEADRIVTANSFPNEHGTFETISSDLRKAIATALSVHLARAEKAERESVKDRAEVLRLAERVGVAEQERDTLRAELHKLQTELDQIKALAELGHTTMTQNGLR